MLLALLLAAPALALDCAAIVDLVRGGAPTETITRTIRRAETLDAGALDCVRAAGVPAEVVGAVEWRGANAAEKVPALAPRPASDGPSPEATETADPADPVGRAILAYRRGEYVAASVAFADLLRAGEGPESQLRYYLGRSLQQLGLHNAAYREFVAVLEKGPATRYFPFALNHLVEVARALGDRSDLGRLAEKISIEAWSAGAYEELCVARAIRLYEKERLGDERACLDTIREGTLLYTRGRFVAGVAYNHEGKRKSAVRAFTDVVRTEVGVDTREELAAAERIRDLSLLNIARIYYAIGQYESARTYYDHLPATSPYAPQAAMERGWSSFALTDARLGEELARLEKTSAGAWLPELPVLRGVHHFRHDLDDPRGPALLEAQHALFTRRYGPVLLALMEVLAKYAPDEEHARAGEVYARYFGRGAARPELPPELLAHLRRDGELAGLLARLAAMEGEVARIGRERAWKGALATELLAGLEKDRLRLERHAGLALLQEMITQASYLRDLSYQLDLLSYEAVARRERDAVSHPETVRALRALLERESDRRMRVEIQFRLANLLDTPAERIPLYEKLLAEHPDYARADEVTWELALDRIEAGEAATATETLRTLVERWPDSPHVETLRKASAQASP